MKRASRGAVQRRLGWKTYDRLTAFLSALIAALEHATRVPPLVLFARLPIPIIVLRPDSGAFLLLEAVDNDDRGVWQPRRFSFEQTEEPIEPIS